MASIKLKYIQQTQLRITMLISLALVITNVRIASYFKCFAAPVVEGNALDQQMSIFQNPFPPATSVCFANYEGNVKDYVATS